MAKNQGMTNSARFYNSNTNSFDIQKCFECNADSFNHVMTNMKFIVEHPNDFTEADLQFHSNQLADDFYTIISIALEWEKKKLKVCK